MKNITLKYLSILFAFTMLFTSCSDDDTDVDLSQERLSSLYFNFSTSKQIVTESEGEVVIKVPVAASYFYNTDRKFKIAVDEDKTTAPASSYSINATSFVVPANEIGGHVEVTLKYDPTQAIAQDFTIVLDLASDHPNFLPIESNAAGLTYTLNFQQLDCDPIDTSPIAGNWIGISNGTNTDGQQGGVAVDHEYAIVISDAGNNAFTFSEALGGLYLFWYAAPYNYPGETPADLKVNVCGKFNGTFNSSFTGDEVTYTGEYNVEEDTITISWTNAFGDQATTLYTRQ